MGEIVSGTVGWSKALLRIDSELQRWKQHCAFKWGFFYPTVPLTVLLMGLLGATPLFFPTFPGLSIHFILGLIVSFLVVSGLEKAELKVLPGPYEFLELADGESVRLAVARFEEGFVTIHPRLRDAPPVRTVKCLRLWVKPDFKVYVPPYWDVDAQTLVAQLKPLLPKLVMENREFIITAHGNPPKKRYSIRLV